MHVCVSIEIYRHGYIILSLTDLKMTDIRFLFLDIICNIMMDALGLKK